MTSCPASTAQWLLVCEVRTASGRHWAGSDLPASPQSLQCVVDCQRDLSCAGLVAGKKRRYQQGGFDLDLAYVTGHVIAMSYPFEGLQGQNVMIQSYLDPFTLAGLLWNVCNTVVFSTDAFYSLVCYCTGWYRNPLSRVRKLLESKHNGHFMLFNLCSERCYKASKFGIGIQVASFPFEDHQVKLLPLAPSSALSFFAVLPIQILPLVFGVMMPSSLCL